MKNQGSVKNRPTDLAPVFQADAMLAERDAVLEMVRQALDTLAEASKRAGRAGLGGLTNRRGYSIHFSLDAAGMEWDLAELRRGLDTRGWATLLMASGMRAFMDPHTTQQWDHDLHEGNTPPLDASTIQATFDALAEQRADLFAEAVRACYRRLSWDRGPKRANAWEYKEEDGRPVALGARLVVEGFARASNPWEWNLENVADLDRLFAVLDGKPTHDHRAAMRKLLWHPTRHAQREEATTDYMHIRSFKNGSKHLTFLRPDLVDRLNAIAGALAPALLPAPAKYLTRGRGKAREKGQ